MAQTFVSTEPSNRNVILEEFTGINCGFCPDGHAQANEACAAHPDHAWTINIHQGSFAANTYTTPWGDALAEQSGLDGYPEGTVNRHMFMFTNNVTILDRSQFFNSVNTIRSMPSPVNVAARVEIDTVTRAMRITVEAYFTGNQAVNSNMLNIALLQNNIIGHQSNYGNYNPDYIVGDNYRHMHMLRDLITGQWGEEITNIAQGTFFTKEYVYIIPASISHEPVVIEDLDVLVFIAEGHQEILTGCKAEITYNEISLPPAILSCSNHASNDCDVAFNASVTVANASHDTITSAKFAYVVNGDTNVYDWTGAILPGINQEIELPTINNELASSTLYTLGVTLTEYNGEAIESDSAYTDLVKEVYEANGPLHFVLGTDAYSIETSFKFMSTDGTIIAEGGPWTSRTEAGVYERRYTISPVEPGCYILEVYDAYGDGINSGYGSGFFSMDNEEGQIFYNDGRFGSKATYYINVINAGDGSFIGIDEATSNVLEIYPNPTTNILNIQSSQNINQITVFDMAGRQVMNINGNSKHINIENLSNGIYTLRVITEGGISTQKFVKE